MTTTTVLTIVVIAVLGNILLTRVRDGLLDDKVQAALIEAASGSATAQESFDSADRASGEADYDTLSRDIVFRLSSAGGAAGANEVALLPAAGASKAGAPSGASSREMDLSTIPASLRARVHATAGPAVELLPVHGARPERPSRPSRSARWSAWRPTATTSCTSSSRSTRRSATLGLVRQGLGLAAVGLVLLVGGIGWLVTRQVVTPVRMAARIAERLSAGRLEERMRVRGEDDLARLATSFNKMAISLQRQIRQLEDLSRVQRRFVSDVSHELRTPLTTVRMAADVLHEARAEFDPAVERSAEILQTQLDRFEALLADLLEISRYDAGAAVLETEPVDLRLVAESVVEAMEPLAERKGSDLVVRAPRTPCIAEVDTRRIERVLRNLLANAIEHGEGRADRRARRGRRPTRLPSRSATTGWGWRPGEAAMVFNRFWRADPARARTTGGTGLGLSISMEDAHLHGGWLQVWGEAGDGSQFRLTVPREPGTELEQLTDPAGADGLGPPASAGLGRRSLSARDPDADQGGARGA